MDDFAPPPGPPPPQAPEVPAGWAARYNEQYQQWFYVNVYTKKSQWDKPTKPVFPQDDGAPSEPPPGYEPGQNAPTAPDTKKNPYEDRSGDNSGSKGSANDYAQSSDAELAARLQAEENARSRGQGGPSPQPPYPGQHSQGYGGPSPGPGGPGSPFPQQLPARTEERGSKSSGGFLGKLMSKAQGKLPQSRPGGPVGYGGPPGYGGQPSYGPQQGHYPQQQQYGGYPQHGPPGGYGGYGGYPQQGPYGQPGMMQQGGRRQGGGGSMMPMMGGAAMGMGAGMLGGMALGSAMSGGSDDEREAYQDGYADGAGGDDFDGGDFE